MGTRQRGLQMIHKFAALLLLAPWAWAEMVIVPDLVVPAELAERTEEEKLRLKEEALEVIEVLEAQFPQSARLRATVTTQRPSSDPPEKKLAGEISFARAGDQLFFLCTFGQGWSRSSSYNGQQGRVLYDGINKTTGAKVGAIIDPADFDGDIRMMLGLGLENLTPFKERCGVSGLLNAPLCTPGEGCGWEVLSLDEQKLLLRIINGSGSSIFELDRTHGGNVIRQEYWVNFGTEKSQRISYLEQYELTQVENSWLPLIYTYYSPHHGGSTSRYDYEWLELGIDAAPENFVVAFPEGTEIRDQTTVAARATRLKAKMAQKVEAWHISFWELFE
jgi:hypothetical protein